MEYYSVIKNEIGLCVETWMDLKTVIQSEVSQKEKSKCHKLSIQLEPETIGIKDCIYKAETDRDIENKCLDTRG